MERYGYEYVLQVPEVKEKSRQTCIERYGADYPNKSPEQRAKVAQTAYKNGTVTTSKQQLYIYNLYKLKDKEVYLNYPVFGFYVDICFTEEKLAVEIDFGGHNLSVKLGTYTQEEFNRREIIRDQYIKKEGYRQMRIISTKDFLPSDQVLLQMLDETRNYFTQFPNHSWIEFNIDSSVVCNAEQRDGVEYNYGELRKIKDSDLSKFVA